jgi:hypothetical protein
MCGDKPERNKKKKGTGFNAIYTSDRLKVA